MSAARQTEIAYPVQRNRLAGLRDGLAEVGVDWASVPIWERFDHSVEAGESAAAELLAAHPELTAVVCTSDILALGALRHATDRGLTVPDDLTITGFDGVPGGRARRPDHGLAAGAGEGPGGGGAAARTRRPQPLPHPAAAHRAARPRHLGAPDGASGR